MKVMFLDLDPESIKSGYGEIVGSFGVRDEHNQVIPYFIIMTEDGNFLHIPINKCHKETLDGFDDILRKELKAFYVKQGEAIDDISKKIQQDIDKLSFVKASVRAEKE